MFIFSLALKTLRFFPRLWTNLRAIVYMSRTGKLVPLQKLVLRNGPHKSVLVKVGGIALPLLGLVVSIIYSIFRPVRSAKAIVIIPMFCFNSRKKCWQDTKMNCPRFTRKWYSIGANLAYLDHVPEEVALRPT